MLRWVTEGDTVVDRGETTVQAKDGGQAVEGTAAAAFVAAIEGRAFAADLAGLEAAAIEVAATDARPHVLDTAARAAVARGQADLADRATAGDVLTNRRAGAGIGAQPAAAFVLALAGLAHGLALGHHRTGAVFTAHPATTIAGLGADIAFAATYRDHGATKTIVTEILTIARATGVAAGRAGLADTDAGGDRDAGVRVTTVIATAVLVIDTGLAALHANAVGRALVIHAAQAAAVDRGRAGAIFADAAADHADDGATGHGLAPSRAALGRSRAGITEAGTKPGRAQTEVVLATPRTALGGVGAGRRGGGGWCR